MKKYLLAAVLAALLIPIFSSAEEVGKGVDLSANVSLGTDYVWRGVTQTNEDPAVSGGLDLSHTSGLYVGTWASNVVGGTEFDVYGGLSNDLFGTGISYDVGAIKYLYPSQGGLNFYEVYGGLSGDVGVASPYVKVWWDPDNETEYYDGGLDLNVLTNIGLSAHYGKYDSGAYDWSLGASTTLLSLDWSVAYVDHENDEDHVVFTVGKAF